MTEEEKKELQELRDMEELQRLRKMKAEAVKQESKAPTVAPQKKKGSSVLMKCLIGFVLFNMICVTFSLVMGDDVSSISSEPKVENFNDNSEFHQILAKNYFKDYIKKNLKDPDSYDEIEYSSVYNEARQCYVVDLKYRANNSFGGKTIERYICDVKFEGNNVKFENITKLN